MNKLEIMVLGFAVGRLPKDVTLFFGEQEEDAYGFLWVIPPGGPFIETVDNPSDWNGIAHAKEEIQISTIETPGGKIRAGYSEKVRALFLIYVNNSPDFIHPHEIQRGPGRDGQE